MVLTIRSRRGNPAKSRLHHHPKATFVPVRFSHIYQYVETHLFCRSRHGVKPTDSSYDLQPAHDPVTLPPTAPGGFRPAPDRWAPTAFEFRSFRTHADKPFSPDRQIYRQGTRITGARESGPPDTDPRRTGEIRQSEERYEIETMNGYSQTHGGQGHAAPSRSAIVGETATVDRDR